MRVGDCVKIPDGRIGRIREVSRKKARVRVQRTTSKTHQFLVFPTLDLEKVPSPEGWMSPEGYRRYLTITLAKQKQRMAQRQARLRKKQQAKTKAKKAKAT